jgi:FkbM family methyltransferase
LPIFVYGRGGNVASLPRIMSLGKKLYGIAFDFRQGALGTALARAWHRWAPSVPVWRKLFGVHVCMDLRDSLYWWAVDSQRIEAVEGLDKMLAGVKGNIWDIGCNVGIFSLYAAAQGNRVTAFDLSPKAIRLLQKSAARNGFDIRTVPRAFSTKSFSYAPPADADTRNQLAAAAGGSHTSITFQEAEREFGTPMFIKMDIEHHETEFLKSAEFRDWIRTCHIGLIIELHEPGYWDLVWPDVPHVRFDDWHVLFNPTQK